ncbi:uncharacterized protein [Procambarus clarkii]|uniref:uncharacterized protein isoform X1 n=2 Tax=Procambarus clarkii TaxID=6728 RepID=UPI003743F15E
MAPGPRSRRQVSHSGRVSKKLTKMADVNSPKERETRCQQKTEETQQSCKKIKVDQTMEDDTCRGWACCTDDNEIKVKHEPLEVEGQADSSDRSHDGRVTGEEDRKDPLFIDTDSTNVTSETSDCNQMTLISSRLCHILTIDEPLCVPYLFTLTHVQSSGGRTFMQTAHIVKKNTE